MSQRLTKEERRYHREILKQNLKGRKLVDTWTLNRLTGTVYIKHEFTNNSAEFMQAMGYYRAEKYLDTLCGIGMPCFVKFENFTVADLKDNRETASTLRDYCDSNIDKKMRAGFSKIQWDAMDVKSLGLILCIAAGVIIGFYLLSGGF